MTETAAAVRERPILFSGPMVQAILDGRKTQTRRLVTPQPVKDAVCLMPLSAELVGVTKHGGPIDKRGWLRCPFGVPGDRLWVRETWAAVRLTAEYDEGYPTGHYEIEGGSDHIPADDEGFWTPVYAADDGWESHRDDRGFAWRPPIFMPRWASRLVLEITAVRVERLQEISESDAIAEGCNGWNWFRHPQLGVCTDEGELPTEEFRRLWDEINGKRATWESNPWVWVVTFRRIV